MRQTLLLITAAALLLLGLGCQKEIKEIRTPSPAPTLAMLR